MNLHDRLEALAARLPTSEPEQNKPSPITAAGTWARLWPPDMDRRWRVVAIAAVVGAGCGASNLALAGLAASPLRLAAGALAVGLVIGALGPAGWRTVELSGRRRRQLLLVLASASFIATWLAHVVVAAVVLTIRAAALLSIATAFGWGLWHRHARRKAAKRQRHATIPEGFALVPIRPEPNPSPPS